MVMKHEEMWKRDQAVVRAPSRAGASPAEDPTTVLGGGLAEPGAVRLDMAVDADMRLAHDHERREVRGVAKMVVPDQEEFYA